MNHSPDRNATAHFKQLTEANLYAAASVAVLTAALVLPAWWLGGHSSLLQRPFWMDEVHSRLLIDDPDLPRAMSALADGADYNPPAWFLLARVTRFVPDVHRAMALRVFSSSLMLSAAVAVCLLASGHVDRLSAIAAAMLFAGNPLIVEQLTEVRFYAAWTAALAWLCVLMQWYRQNADHRVVRCVCRILIVPLTVFICTCHYFGIISILLLTAVCWLVSRHRLRERRFQLMLAAAGIVAVCGCLPFLAGQRAALSRPTWISAPTAGSVAAFLDETTPWRVLSVLLPAAICFGSAGLSGIRTGLRTAACVPGAGLVLMAPALIAFSFLIQPALVARYATVSSIGFVPFAAVLISRLPPPLRLCTVLLALASAVGNGRQTAMAWHYYEQSQDRLIEQIDGLPNHSLLIFEDRAVWLALVDRRPDLAERCQLADFEDSQLATDSALRIVQRDVGRKLCHWYPWLRMRKLESLPELPEYWVVSYRGGSDRDLHYPGSPERQQVAASIFHFRNAASVVVGSVSAGH